MRLFYALFVPSDLHPKLLEVQAKARSYKGWRLTRPEQFHLTLLFMGQVSEDRLDLFSDVGQKVSEQVAPFGVKMGGTGYFPEGGTPRVWFVKANGEGLEPLAVGLRQALPGFAGESEKFKPHITLARKKGPAPRLNTNLDALEFTATEFCLVESELDKTGSKYRIVERFMLEKPSDLTKTSSSLVAERESW
jgi:2'-5' RNA ligase